MACLWKDQQDKFQNNLPAVKHREEVIKKVFNSGSPVTLITGGTGSGKTTKVPMMLVDYLKEEGKLYPDKPTVCVTQPRKLPARLGAKFMNDQSKNRNGYSDGVVGSWVRFERNVKKSCKVVMMTDGILMRQIQGGKSPYKIIVIDEAHERGVNSDILLSILKEMVYKKEDLRLIIMSATLDKETFLKHFGLKEPDNLVEIQGTNFPVQTYYTDQGGCYMDIGVEQCLRIHHQNTEDISSPFADILFFLPGKGEIEKAAKMLEHLTVKDQKFKDLEVHRLYAGRNSNEQKEATRDRQSGASRRIVLATNVAESSITIVGVKYVIDCGYVKKNNFKPEEGFTQLAMETISRASAKQRRGRAGRTGPGKCYRLYSQEVYQEHFNESTVPEILREDITNVVLNLYGLGHDRPWTFDFIKEPTHQQWAYALRCLKTIGAIEKVEGADYQITDEGHLYCQLPLDPEDAACLIRARKYNVARPVAKILAFKQILDRGLFKEDRGFIKHRRDFAHPWGDHFSYLNVMEAYHACLNSNENHAYRRNNYSNSRDSGLSNKYKELFNDYGFKLRSLHDADNIFEQLISKLQHLKQDIKNLHPHDKRYYPRIAKSLLYGRRRNIAIRHSNKSYLVIPHMTMKIQPAGKGFLKCIPSEGGNPALPAVIFFDPPKARDSVMEATMASFCHPFWLYEKTEEDIDHDQRRLWSDDVWETVSMSIRNYLIAYVRGLMKDGKATKSFCDGIMNSEDVDAFEQFVKSKSIKRVASKV